MRKVIVLLLLFSFAYSLAIGQSGRSTLYPFSLEFDKNRSLIITFKEPPGYQRFPMANMTRYMIWLTNLPLATEYHPLTRYDKQIIVRSDSIGGIIDIGVTTNNQKDADFPIQVAAEYLKVINQLDSFPFIINNHDTLRFDRWLNGKYSTDARGNLVYRKGEKLDHSEKEFYRYLEFIIRKNTRKSLINNLYPVSVENLIPGDIYIQSKETDSDDHGHVLMILDICSNENGDRLYLLGQGGNPAQSYHIPITNGKSKSVWFTMDQIKEKFKSYGDGKFYRYMNLINL